MLISVVIRTYNEEKYLDELLTAVFAQDCPFSDIEVVIVDSGSTDDTLEIAGRHGCRITHITQQEFSFGRSLNVGCEFARGDYLVFVSGHCVPESQHWIDRLVQPLISGEAAYVYGRQRGRVTTRFSERQYFDKAFPDYSKIPQQGYFCNNANAAIRRDAWESFRFDEQLTGLEDMYLAKRLTEAGMKVAYVADASVSHIHDESSRQIRTRYEREAYALHQIMPQLHFTLRDFLRFFVSGVLADSAAALREKRLFREFPEIFMFRLMHYWGTYRGNHQVRQLSADLKFRYFYPKDVERHIYEKKVGGASTYEGPQ
jgi:rhamnosyltransferase